MLFVEICVGSSCHLKGSEEVVEKMQKAIETQHLGNEIVLSGSFCMEKCNRVGVTVKVDDEIYTGVRPETFDAFFEENIVKKIRAEGGGRGV